MGGAKGETERAILGKVERERPRGKRERESEKEGEGGRQKVIESDLDGGAE